MKQILTNRSLIAVIGLLLGLAVLGQPLVRDIIENHETCQSTSAQEDTQAEDDKQTEQEQVSTLEALAPVQHAPDASTEYFILDEIFLEIDEIKAKPIALMHKTRDKLVRVLFNFIIAPNAP